MFDLGIDEILRAVRGRLIRKGQEKSVSGISSDTRAIKRGDLFIALSGKNFDGHNFIQDAIDKGACAIIVGARFIAPVDNGFDKSNPYIIRVKDTLAAYGDIAHYYRMKFDIPFIGITGSNGKTTVKEMVAKVLGYRFSVLKNDGTENNMIGVSKTLLKLCPDHNMAVLELGTNHFGEIRGLVSILRPSAGIITNIGPGHLEFLRSEEGVLKEKSEMVRSLDRNGTAFLNADDPYLGKINKLKAKIVRFGIDNDCEFKATDITRLGAKGTEFAVNSRYRFRINLPGKENIYNALAAIAVGFSYKREYRDIYNALLEFAPVKGRLCHTKIGAVDIIDDTYNANPQSVRLAIDVLAGFKTSGRRIFVCGDMLELGPSAGRFHEEIGRAVADSGIDILIAVGKFSGMTAGAAVSRGMPRENVLVGGVNPEVAEALKKIIKDDDVILLKGSRLMKLNEVIDALLSFIPAQGSLVRI